MVGYKIRMKIFPNDNASKNAKSINLISSFLPLYKGRCGGGFHLERLYEPARLSVGHI